MRAWFLAAASAAALSVGATGAAYAQDGPSFDRGRNQSVLERPRPDYAPAGLQIGAFIVRPSVEADVIVVDNVFAEETGEDSDVILSLRPRMDVETTWSRHGVKAELGAERSVFVDFPKNDAFDPFVGLEGRIDVRRSGAVRAGARLEEITEARTSPDAPTAVVKPVEVGASTLYASASYAFNRIRLSGGVLQRALDFEDAARIDGGSLDQDFRDRTERSASARVEVALTPGVSALFEGRADERDYDQRPPAAAVDRQSYGRAYVAGLNFDITRLVRGDVAAGYFERDYKDPAIGTVDGLALQGRVDWFPTELTTVTAQFARSAEDSGTEGAASFVLSRAGVRVDHELRRNIVLSAAVEVGRRAYQDVDRDDELLRLEASGVYFLNRRLGVRAGVAHDRQASSGLARDRDFEANRAFLGLVVRL